MYLFFIDLIKCRAITRINGYISRSSYNGFQFKCFEALGDLGKGQWRYLNEREIKELSHG